MDARELTNGFANRFLTIWAERTSMIPFPRATPQAEVNALAQKVIKVIEFAGGDRCAEVDKHQIDMTLPAQSLFAKLYYAELNDESGGEKITALLERRAPVLRRLAMLFALCDLQMVVDVQHVNAALAWTRYWADSVKFIFSDGLAEAQTAETNATAQKIIHFLEKRKKATRSELSKDCFGGHQSKCVIDAALDELLAASPAKLIVETVPRPKTSPGSPTKIYSMAAKSAKCAQSEHPCGFAADSDDCGNSEVCETSSSTFRTLSTLRETSGPFESRANADV